MQRFLLSPLAQPRLRASVVLISSATPTTALYIYTARPHHLLSTSLFPWSSTTSTSEHKLTITKMDMQYFQSVFAQSKQSETPRVGTIPGRPDLKGIPYFEYGSYFLGDEFRKLCPSAVPIGIGWLASWTWHINTEGKHNCAHQDIFVANFLRTSKCTPG